MKTKIATVYYSETVHIKNTIEVPIDWTKKDIENDPEGILIIHSKVSGPETKINSIEINKEK